MSETARQSRIISLAATKLGRGSVHDKHMHLRDVNGMEASISVDVVETIKELLEGEDPCRGSPKPHMVLSPKDERRIKGMMLIGWMGQANLLKGWASQGKKKGQSAPEAGEKKAGEGATFKHLKVKIKGQEMRISALFDKDVPNTLIGYGAAAILGLKGGQTRRWVTTKEGNRGMSYAWYDVPLQGGDGRVWQIRASGVLRTARVKNECKNGETLGDSPGGIMGPPSCGSASTWSSVETTRTAGPGTLWAGQGDQREAAL